MENVEVHVTADNTKEAHELMRAAMAHGLEEMGLVAEGYAKAGCPRDIPPAQQHHARVGI